MEIDNPVKFVCWSLISPISTGCPKKNIPSLVSLTEEGTLFLVHPVI